MEVDVVIKGGKVVFPNEGILNVDLGIKGGKIEYIGKDLHFSSKDKVIDASKLYVLPGIIDSHTHIGIHENIPTDARTETAAAISGGITSVLNYYRAGRNNVETETEIGIPKPYLELFPDVLKESEGNFYTDYGYHLAPVTREHIEEIPKLVSEFGVTTFKFYMHYKGVKPGSNFDPSSLNEHLDYLFTDDEYDLGFLYKIMSKVAQLNDKGHKVRVNVHCEDPALTRVFKEITKLKSATMTPLQMYNSAKPPNVERLAIMQATELAFQTGAPMTIVHASSREAVTAIEDTFKLHKNMDLGIETTLHHLTLSIEHFDDTLGKVNPPIRDQAEVDSLWEAVESDIIQTIVTDSAGSRRSLKPKDIWKAKPGFSGLEVFLPAIVTEGHFKRGIPLEKLIGKMTKNPAKLNAIGNTKGDIKIGMDADLVICDMHEEKTVGKENRFSAQDFNLFEGFKLRGFPVATILRGEVVYENGELIGSPTGKYLKRPC